MTLPSYRYTTGIKMVLKQIDAAATTKTVWITDRYNFAATADGAALWPILLEVQDFGAQMDEFLPQPFNGGFTIDNTIGTFGLNRKFGDLLERYTLIDQWVEIYIDQGVLNSSVISFAAGELALKARVTGVEFSMDENQPTISVSLGYDPIPDRQLNVMVNEVTAVSGANEVQSQGKYLPLAAGAYNYLPAYRIKTGTTDVRYAYATNYGNDFIHGIDSIYAEDKHGEWCQITSNVASVYSKGAATLYYSLDPASYKERYFEIKNPSSYNGILTAVGFQMKAAGSAGRTSTAVITVSVYEGNSLTGTEIRDKVASGKHELTDDDSNNDAGIDFAIYIQLEQPAVLNYGKRRYWIGVTCSSWGAGDANIYRCASDDCECGLMLLQEYTYLGDQDAPAMACYFSKVSGASYTSANWDANGLASAEFMIEAANSYSVPEDVWANLNLIVKTAGLKDIDGQVSGTILTLLDRFDWFVEALSYTYSGGSFSANTNWDWDTYAAYYGYAYDGSRWYTRYLIGSQDPPVTYREMLETVCRDSISRVGINNSGQLFLWPWGPTYTPAATIPAEDINPLSWSIGDTSSVINRVVITYGVTNIDIVAFRNTKQKRNFTGTLDRCVPTKGTMQALAAQSVIEYGRRERRITESNYVGDATSAEVVLNSYFARYSQPIVLCSIEVPYDDYSSLKLLDVIEFGHPAFPSYKGCAVRHEEIPEDGASAERSFLKGGRHWHQYAQYRATIEGRTVQKPRGGAPRLILTLRVLNFGIDPT